MQAWVAAADLRSREGGREEGGRAGNFDVQSSKVEVGTIPFIFYTGAVMFYLIANVITARQTVKTVLWF